jgi:hypothetical protein
MLGEVLAAQKTPMKLGWSCVYCTGADGNFTYILDPPTALISVYPERLLAHL